MNRRSEIPLARIFPHIKGAARDPAYNGGPVETTSGQGLLRTPNAESQERHVVGDIYATGSKELIEKLIGSHIDASRFRLYLGYAGWAPGQLEAEVEAGAWSILTGSARIVFDDDPDTLWSRLTRESQMRIASRAPMRAAVAVRPQRDR